MAQAEGLWNLFMPPGGALAACRRELRRSRATQLTNLEYALCAEEMGRILWSAEVFNCSAPDTGNMEVLHRYGTRAQKDEWLGPLMDGEIRSAFLMTEPAVASSDATNIECEIERDGDDYVINGRKWWSSGAGDPRCKVAILMGKTDPGEAKHRQQSMILVPLDAPGVTVERALTVYGYDDAPHGHMEIVLKDVRVPASTICCSAKGAASRSRRGGSGPGGSTIACGRSARPRRRWARWCGGCRAGSRSARRSAEHSVWEQRVAEARIDIDMSRLLCLKAADMMDKAGNKAAAGRDRDDQGQGAAGWRCRSSTTRSRRMAGPASARISRSRRAGRASARCASPTGPTKSTTARSRGSNSPSTRRADLAMSDHVRPHRTRSRSSPARRAGSGRAIAEALADHGARVVISSRKQDACEEVADEINAKHGEGRAIAIAASISSKEALQALVDETHSAFGRIDVLVCNAASNPYYGPMAGISDEQFRKILDNNVIANHWLISMAAPEMLERGEGSIIIVSSIGGLTSSTMIGAYNISKAADFQLARNLAAEFGPQGVRVNCIAPGLVRTDFAKACGKIPTR